MNLAKILVCLGAVILPGVAHALSCDEAKAKIAEGFKVDLTVEGVSIFDPDVVKRKTITMLIKPKPLNKPCKEWYNGSNHALDVFLQKDLIAEINGKSYAGAFVPESSDMQSVTYFIVQHQFVFPSGDNFKKKSIVAFFHAVPASLAKEMGFDSYEAPGASPYIDIVDLGVGQGIPFSSIVGSFLGIAGKDGHFYQTFTREFKVSLANP